MARKHATDTTVEVQLSFFFQVFGDDKTAPHLRPEKKMLALQVDKSINQAHCLGKQRKISVKQHY